MKRKNIVAFGIISFALLSSCTRQDGSSSRDNPFDANGTNWTQDSKPIVTSLVDTLPLWYDYDFVDNSGSIACKARIIDNNGIQDTLTSVFLIGTTSPPKDTVRVYMDSVFIASRLNQAQRYYYTITTRDKFDSTASVSGAFITPLGVPPRMTDSIVIGYDYNYYSSYSCIPINWYNIDRTATYLIYRSNSVAGPFFLIADTVVPASALSGYYSDCIADSKIHYYRLSALNSFGECKSKNTYMGYVPTSSLSAPYSLSASSGTYPDYIRLSWYANSTSGGTYLIFKSASSSGQFFLLDSTQAFSYCDTIKGSISGYYYKLAQRDLQGRISAPSSFTYGYISAMGIPSPTASQGSYYSYIRLSWYAVPGAAGYYIYRSLSSTGTFQCIDTVAAPPSGSSNMYCYDSVKTTDNYYYAMAAYSSSGKVSGQSPYTVGYLLFPKAPAISASKGASLDYIAVSWALSVAARIYYVYRGQGASIDDTLYLIDSTSKNVYYDSVKKTGAYYYAVRMVDTSGRISEKSAIDYGYLAFLFAPTISASKGTYFDFISVSWLPSATAVMYYIYRAKGTDIVDSLKLIDSTSKNNFNDSVKTTGTYYYAVTKKDTSGHISEKSSIDYGYLAVLGTPSALTASTSFSNYITLSWQSVSLALGYYIYRATSASGPFNKIDSVVTTAYKDTSFLRDPQNSADTYYYYKLQAFAARGITGSLSTAATGLLRGFSYPDAVKATTNTYKSKIIVTWGSVVSVTGYCVYRSTSSTGGFVKIASVSGTSYTDSVAPGATIVYYAVSSLKGSKESGYSTPVAGSLLIAPVLSELTSGVNTVQLRWKSPDDTAIKGYNIYRSVDSLAFTRISQAVTSPYSDWATNGKYYYYRVPLKIQQSA